MTSMFGGLLTPPNSKEKEEFPPLVLMSYHQGQDRPRHLWTRLDPRQWGSQVAVWAPEGVAVVTRKAII